MPKGNRAFDYSKWPNWIDPLNFLEACFHGEIWMRCRLCGKTYEAHFQNRDKETGATYCPLCNGYGRASDG